MFGGCPVFGGCLQFEGCPNSEISHGRSVSQVFRECSKDLKYKTNTFVWKMVVI